MISELRIKDYALMETINVSFQKGLNILTGETGAGKSIIVGALGLALGEKGSSGTIRAGKDFAEVEATFDLGGEKEAVKRLKDSGFTTDKEELTLKRVIHRTGRTRCYVNGSPVTLSDLRLASDLLVDIHGQHEHQALLKPETHIDFLDSFAGIEKERERFSGLFEKRNRLTEEIGRREKEAERLRETEELYRFQKREIESANVGEGEEEALESERKVLGNSERLIVAASEAYHRLYEDEGSVSEVVASLKRLLEEISGIDQSMKPHLEEITSVSNQLDEIGRGIGRYKDDIHHDPERLEDVRTRLDVIRSLKKKYGGSIESVLEYRDHIDSQLKRLDQSSFDVTELKEDVRNTEKEMSALARVLSEARKTTAEEFEKKVAAVLKELGMAKCRFVAQIDREECDEGPVVVEKKRFTTSPNGIDMVEFLLSANPGEPVKPLARIASGGETSRIMLGLKSILSDVDKVGTLIFDEVDIGIGGRVAESVGKKLKRVAKSRQVICITHLPQIAIQGDNHYAVTKEVKERQTFTSISILESRDRVMEVARMLGGKKITDATLNAAREMLKSVG
ncbi:DNA repair protein RecN [candidate division TA06 bacterium]|uniref:DNA repair protein RecN n=1 Tax=candidate division TA06 bacterium TaxID=2250710 RepID=A0A523XLX9_UNCT6|nr:MAG: DNA repair protein RecN [candidate division TA06 bacterium]